MAKENYYQSNRLQELKGSGYEIVDGEPDIRGWEVKTTSDQIIGEVDELLFDTQSYKVRYIIVDLDDDVLNIDSKKVLVPIGLAELDEEDDDVILPNVTVEQLTSLPGYEKDNLTEDREISIRNTFAGVGGADLVGRESGNTDDDFYNHPYFDEDRMYNKRKQKSETNTSIPIIEEKVNIGKRTIETGGGVRVKKTVVEQPVEETINLKEEHVTVNRKTVDKPVQEGDLASFKEGTIELTESAEVPVVSKVAKVVEEVTIGKEVEEREQVIKETVRKTEVDVEDLKKKDDLKK